MRNNSDKLTEKIFFVMQDYNTFVTKKERNLRLCYAWCDVTWLHKGGPNEQDNTGIEV